MRNRCLREMIVIRPTTPKTLTTEHSSTPSDWVSSSDSLHSEGQNQSAQVRPEETAFGRHDFVNIDRGETQQWCLCRIDSTSPVN